MPQVQDIGSPSLSLKSQHDWIQIGEGAAVAIASALLTYATNTIPDIDLGATWSPIVMGVWAIVSRAALQFLTNTQKTIRT